MSLFDQLNKPQANSLPDRNQMAGMVSQLQSDPASFLQKMGYNIPVGMDLRNPSTIINYLMQSKQINGGLLSTAMQLLSNFR